MRCGEVNKEEEEEILTCDKPCRAMRSCGRHECMRKCCPLSYQEALKNRSKKRKKRFNAFEDEMGMEDPEGWHECDIVCGRKLSCGVHFCERKDHKGVCGNCLNASFEEYVTFQLSFFSATKFWSSSFYRLICHCGCASPVLILLSLCNPGLTFLFHKIHNSSPTCTVQYPNRLSSSLYSTTAMFPPSPTPPRMSRRSRGMSTVSILNTKEMCLWEENSRKC